MTLGADFNFSRKRKPKRPPRTPPGVIPQSAPSPVVSRTPPGVIPYAPPAASPPPSVASLFRRPTPQPTSAPGSSLTDLAGKYLLQSLNDLLTPGPTTRQIAEAALRLGVKPVEDAIGAVVDTVDEAAQVPRKLARAAQEPVDSFMGRETLGTPTPAQIATAAHQGKVRVNQKGKLTIPATRQALRQLVRADEAVKRDRGGISGITQPGEATEFANALAKYTKLDPQFIGAWVQSEGGGFAAGGQAGRNNWLGVGYPGKPTPFGRSDYFSGDAESAAKATADWMRGQIGADMNYQAAEGIQQIIPKAAGKGPEAALQALQESGWGTHIPLVRQNLASVSVEPPNPKALKQLEVAKANARAVGINPTPFNGDVEGGEPNFTWVRADAKGMVDWVESALGTDEGTAKQQRWADAFGLGYTQPWCANFVSNGLLRRGFSRAELPANPNFTGTSSPGYQTWGEEGRFATIVEGGLANAKPGDILTFGEGGNRHVGVYVGNGEYTSGNSSDSVNRNPVDSDLWGIIRPKYKGGKVKVADSQVAGSSMESALGGVGGGEVAGGAGGGVAGGSRQLPSFVGGAQVPISELLQTLALEPQLGGPAEDEEGLIDRILAGGRL